MMYSTGKLQKRKQIFTERSTREYEGREGEPCDDGISTRGEGKEVGTGRSVVP